jgi:hypothetical protein
MFELVHHFLRFCILLDPKILIYYAVTHKKLYLLFLQMNLKNMQIFYAYSKSVEIIRQKCTRKKFIIIFCGLECVGHSFAYVAHFVFLGDVWIRTQIAAVASRCAVNIATHLPLSHPSPF